MRATPSGSTGERRSVGPFLASVSAVRRIAEAASSASEHGFMRPRGLRACLLAGVSGEKAGDLRATDARPPLVRAIDRRPLSVGQWSFRGSHQSQVLCDMPWGRIGRGSEIPVLHALWFGLLHMYRGFLVPGDTETSM